METYHIIYRSNNRWCARKQGATRASKVFDRKSDAICWAKERGRAIPHNKNGMLDSRIVREAVRKVLYSRNSSKRAKTARGSALTPK